MKHYLQITSGQGPDECCLAVLKTAEVIMKEAKEENISVQIIDESSKKGDSILLLLNGDAIDAFINHWEGSVLWIVTSPYRPNHKRKNWYLWIEYFCFETTKSNIDVKDVVFQTMKSSGPGGQHVNTTDSAVRATHVPSGLIVKASEERSQHLNKKLAFERLQYLMHQKEKDQQHQLQNQQWKNHQNIVRGNPIRTFVGMNFIEKKEI
jgi:peptide chain release factor